MNKKLILCCAGTAILTACTGKKQPASPATETDTLYMLVGSYGPADQEGIKVYKFNQETGKGQYVSGLKGISNPSYQTISKDGKRVYSVGEDDGGTACANALTFDATTGTLTLVNSQPTQGAAPCHIALSPEEDYVVTANYNGSNITLFPLDAEGRLKPGKTSVSTAMAPTRNARPNRICTLSISLPTTNTCWPTTWAPTASTASR